MARVTTRAERHCEEGVERGWWRRRRRRKDRVQACVPFSWKRPRGIVHAAYIQTNNGSTGTRVCENIYSGRLLLSVCPNKSLEWTSIWSRAFSWNSLLGSWVKTIPQWVWKIFVCTVMIKLWWENINVAFIKRRLVKKTCHVRTTVHKNIQIFVILLRNLFDRFDKFSFL